jgi:hypothetical protein
MLSTLRITSYLAAIAAVILLICAAVFGGRKDPHIEEFLRAPSAVDKFPANKGQGRIMDEGQVSPLVKQAMDLATKYLNPPPPIVEQAPPPPPTVTQPQVAPPTVSAKFELKGTSHYATRPELSLALIDEPGKGLHWVRQGNSVGHLVIEKVGNGSITVRDGQRTFDMTIEVKEPWRELIRGDTLPSGGQGNIPPSMQRTLAPKSDSMPDIGEPSRAVPLRPPSREPSAMRQPGRVPARRETAKIAPVAPAIKETPSPPTSEQPLDHDIIPSPPPPMPTEKDVIRLRLMQEVKASRITPEEAKRMEELAETLEQLEELQRQKAAGRRDANSSPPAK